MPTIIGALQKIVTAAGEVARDNMKSPQTIVAENKEDNINNEEEEEQGASILTIIMLVCLSYPIARFLRQEYLLARRKATDQRIAFAWHDQLQYRLDFYLSSSESSKVLLLLAITYLLILCGSLMLQVVTGLSLSTSTWLAWTYIADPGTHADAEGDLNKIVSFLITIGGMLIFALMIGIISESIGQHVDQLKEGKSRVIESDHTLILGWSDKTLAIIQQIALANESENGGTIVVLADMSKAEMESILSSAIEKREDPLRLLGTGVVFREGDSLLETSLERVSVRTARSIIALSTTTGNEDADEADSRMVRQVLSLKAIGSDLPCHVVVEVQDVDNKHLVELVASEFVEVIVAHDIIGRLMIQCARHPGLAYVLESLLGFDGDEFYLESWDSLTEKTFFDITCRFDNAIPVGVKIAETGEIRINPENTYMIQQGDEILVLAEDNDTYTVNDGKYDIDKAGHIPENSEEREEKKETLLFCGWRRDMADMVTQLDGYVQKGSELWLFNLVPVEQREELFLDNGNKDPIVTRNLTLMNAVGNPIVRRDLRELEALDFQGKKIGRTVTIDMFDSILILANANANENGSDMQSADSKSLASLLIIQDIQRKYHEANVEKGEKEKKPCYPISEILDTRTRSLLKIAGCKGYVMSNQIVSSAMAQISENRDMNSVLSELLSAEGNESHLRDVSLFINVEEDEKKSFWDIALLARQKGEVLVGYKQKEYTFLEASATILNPPEKSKKRRWHKGDVMVLFAAY